MSINIIPRELRYSNTVSAANKNCVAAYIAERKFLKLLLKTVPPESYEKITGKKLSQLQGVTSSKSSMFKEEIKKLTTSVSNEEMIQIWKMANNNITEAILKLYSRGKHKVAL